MQAARGCEKDSENPQFWLVDHETQEVYSKRCPLKAIARRASNTVWLASGVEAGLLPDSGGLLDQTNSFVQAIGVISTAKEKARKDAK